MLQQLTERDSTFGDGRFFGDPARARFSPRPTSASWPGNFAGSWRRHSGPAGQRPCTKRGHDSLAPPWHSLWESAWPAKHSGCLSGRGHSPAPTELDRTGATIGDPRRPRPEVLSVPRHGHMGGTLVSGEPGACDSSWTCRHRGAGATAQQRSTEASHSDTGDRTTVTTVGRNDPCPCGSGRKFKHCCLRVQDVEDTLRVRLRSAEGALVPVLFSYAT